MLVWQRHWLLASSNLRVYWKVSVLVSGTCVDGVSSFLLGVISTMGWQLLGLAVVHVDWHGPDWPSRVAGLSLLWQPTEGGLCGDAHGSFTMLVSCSVHSGVWRSMLLRFTDVVFLVALVLFSSILFFVMVMVFICTVICTASFL